MSRDDELAKAAVLSTLQAPKIMDVEFRVGRHSLDGWSFATVVEAILSGRTTVKYHASLGPIAYYNQATDEIEMGFTSAAEIARQGLIVHECVHAAVEADRRRYQRQDRLTTAAAGYIGQCMFVLANLPREARRSARLTGPDAVTDKIFLAAWNIALAYHSGGSVSTSDETDLENALKSHPLYRDKAGEINGYNGVHQHAASPQNAGQGHTH